MDYDDFGEVINKKDPFDVKYLKAFNEHINETPAATVRDKHYAILTNRQS